MQQVALALGPFDQRKIFRVTEREVALDGVDGRYRREYRRSIHQAAHLDGRLAGNATDQRTHMGESQVQLGCLDRSLGGFHCCLRRRNIRISFKLLLRIVIQLALGDRSRSCQRRVAVHIDHR